MTIAARVLAAGNNERGDLLTRLAGDLFFALGYDDCKYDRHKPGRELDVQAAHRFEPRDLVAECKSGRSAVGGADLNKFYGVLDAERRRQKDRDIHGYFVSLGGFTGSALDQEAEFDNSRFALLNGQDVASEIVKSGIVVSSTIAVASAAKHLSNDGLRPEDEPDLIAHAIGWVWAVFFRSKNVRTSVLFIHADGTPLAAEMANEVAKTAASVDDVIADLDLLNVDPARRGVATRARDRYLAYLVNDFGGITLEGMPADQAVGSGQFRLESLYVPLTFSSIDKGPVKAGLRGAVNRQVDDASSEEDIEVSFDGPVVEVSLGRMLLKQRHLAILGFPGSGKTTSLKRLAVAYADPTRRAESKDDLPDQKWFPVLIRCRHLLTSVRQPIIRLILDQIERAEMPEARDEFSSLITEELQKGRVLLLVDGLDEIAASGDRSAFVAQLRTFIATYPTSRMVITSREAGFRSVAAAVNSVCSSYRVNGLTDDGIRTLVEYWHQEAIGNSAAVKAKASDLAQAIVSTDRVRMLATNPLLLTTLLLVQRWIGQLPRRRTVLYQKAIEVLLMTWNAEGHEPLDPEEALPQLSYVAFAMMTNARASITLDELAGLLTSARRDLPEFLSYAGHSVHEFVVRVEERSSLMTISGHEVVDGVLKPTYEFKHLTFQEYLAALAVSHGWLPRALQGHSPLEIIATRLHESSWLEVVNLTAVLSGRHAAEIVQHLIDVCSEEIANLEKTPKNGVTHDSVAFANLCACVRDEVAITPELARSVIQFCILNERRLSVGNHLKRELVESLRGGRYDRLLRDVCYEGMDSMTPEALPFGSAMAKLASLDLLASTEQVNTPVDLLVIQQLESEDLRTKVFATAGLMHLAFRERFNTAPLPRRRGRRRAIPSASAVLVSQAMQMAGRSPLNLMRLWALAWVADRPPTLSDDEFNGLRQVALSYWMNSRHPSFVRFASWAFASLPLTDEWEIAEERNKLAVFSAREYNARGENQRMRRRASLVLDFYLGGEYRERVPQRILESPFDTMWRIEQTRDLLKAVGPAATPALREFEARIAKSGSEHR